MRKDTKTRKKAIQALGMTREQEWWADQVTRIMLGGKKALDAAMLEIGRLTAETIMYMEREERAGADYHPTSPDLQKWASQRGSIYLGDQKIRVEHPRLRGPAGEVPLKTYEQLKKRGGFSEELLGQVLRGMSVRRYEETVTEASKAFGVTPSSVSHLWVTKTPYRLKSLTLRPSVSSPGHHARRTFCSPPKLPVSSARQSKTGARKPCPPPSAHGRTETGETHPTFEG